MKIKSKQGIPLAMVHMNPLIVSWLLLLIEWFYLGTIERYYFLLAILAFLLSNEIMDDVDLQSTEKLFWEKYVFNVVVQWIFVISILWLIGFFTQSMTYFSQQILWSWFFITPITLVIVQVLLRSIKFNWTFKKNFQPKAIIVGINISSIKLYIAYKKNPWLGVECLGFFEDRPMNRVLNKTQQVDLLHLGIINEAHHFIKNNKIDKIYIALPMSAQPRILQLLEELQDTTTSIYFIPDIYLFDLIQPNMTIIMGVPLVAICESPFDGNNGISKRIADILLSSLILMMILPLMVLIAFAVKLSSPGPIIFKQLRYGLDGKEIWIYKFRSMTVSQESELVVQAVQGDPRVTKIGNLLRKTSMDEFPQFFNVLRGNMSIVGPRPHAVSHNELYRRLIKGYMIRHKVKPGITGWAQVNGFRGETDTLGKMEERVKFDLDYLRNWSLFLDLYIIVKTISVVIKDKNAY